MAKSQESASWEHADVFPTIARIIDDQFASLGRYVSHDEVTSALVADSEGATIIAQAQEQSTEPHSAEWIAHNMVAWFSQRISVGNSAWEDRFDRIKIDGKWAYRPKRTP